MAHVDRERGQLILVTGLAIALAMVALVLLLNTAIFTENLASRGADQSGREAIEYQRLMVDGVGELIDAENFREHGSQSTVDDNVSSGIHQVDNLTGRSYGVGGDAAWVNRSTLTLRKGRLIRQTDSSRQFRKVGGTGLLPWQLAHDIEDTRRFVLTVDRSSLVQTNDTLAEVDGAFAVELVESAAGDSWKVYIYENKSTGDVAFATQTGATPTERCSVSASEVTINLTAETVAGSECPGLSWAETVDPDYNIKYHNGKNATGTYHLIVNTSGSGDIESSNLNSNGTSPYFVHAVYSVTADIAYESPTLTYRTEVRAAPGEPE